ncbi:MAG TPA: transglycosylase SLT domain-containing protein [Caulobacteraceae bacterium]
MAIDSIRGVVEAAIQSASNATGVDFGFLLGTAKRESGYNPGAKAQSSSAAGLYQFTEQTWLATLKKYGARHGYARYADLIQPGSDGRLRVAGADARTAVMALRMDPRAAALMAGEMTADHASYLRGRVGRDPTAGELYVAHFLGPAGSAKLIEATRNSPGAAASALFPDAAHANPTIFYRAGRSATVSEVYANLTANPGASRSTAAPQQADVDDRAFVQYASARRLDRVSEQREMVDLILRGPQSVDDVGASATTRATGALFSSEMLRVLSEARDHSGRGG